jgi:acid phosphatase
MYLKSTISWIAPMIALFAAAGCAQQQAAPRADEGTDLGILWVRDSAEYRALALQAYGAAAEDLRRLIDDRSWSALPRQSDAHDLPPAIIFDVDETLVTNVLFQVELEPPFRNHKLDDWNAATTATPVPGAPEFVRLARASGVQVFYVTNRPCETKPGVSDPCPQEAVTIEDLNEAGIPADASSVMMANEMPAWTQEKKARRDLIAKDFRVIMLVGDDLGDFLPCVRARPAAPCTEAATKAGRDRDIEEHRAYWGNGWYVLPNPMHGSWTSAR